MSKKENIIAEIHLKYLEGDELIGKIKGKGEDLIDLIANSIAGEDGKNFRSIVFNALMVVELEEFEKKNGLLKYFDSESDNND